MVIEYSRQFLKSASRLPKRILSQAEIKETIFRVNPFNPNLQTHKLHGKEQEAWAFSINRQYRIKFIFLGNKTVLFLDIGTHDLYK